MEILLDAGYDTQSVVQFGEGTQCVFKNCIFSLAARLSTVQLSVASCVDLAQMMKGETSTPANARIEFHECFVRGKGALIALQGCRPLQVDIKNSLIALDGSLLDIKATSKPMPMNQGVRWKMERSSIFTTESVFALHSGTGKVMTLTEASIDSCVMASLAPSQTIVTYDRAVVDLDKHLKWKGEQNFYANFENQRNWIDDYREPKSKYGNLTFPKLSDDRKQNPWDTLWDATPEMFAPADAEAKSLSGIGVPMESEKRLMLPLPDPDVP